jgi:HK97 gp10 family phage protein
MTETSGFDELQNEFEEFAGELREAASRMDETVDDATRDTSRILKKEMKSNVYQMGAVDTGELVESIRFDKVFTATYTVGPTAEHAVYVEYGTGKYNSGERITPNEAEALAFEDENGEQVIVASVKGQRPRPFFRKATEKIDQAGILEQKVSSEVEELFQEVFG